MHSSMPWTETVVRDAYMLHDGSPYTIRFLLKRAESDRATIDCVRPWRTFTWRCARQDDLTDEA